MALQCVVPRNLINGVWCEGKGPVVESVNPASPDDIVARYPEGTASDLYSAIDAAQSAQGAWEKLGSINRGRILFAVADLMFERRNELAALMTREQGKTLGEALVEVDGSAETIRYHASRGRDPIGSTFPSSFPGEHIETRRRAIGLIAVITPWNFPTQIPAWKIAPALLWGNTVIWKPAADVPALSQAFAAVFHDAGIPAGVLNLVLAPGAVAQALVDSPKIHGITFTGSVTVGMGIAKAATPRGVKVQLELGGNNAAIVMPDVDPEFAAKQLAIGAMSGSGQKCTATRRIITVGASNANFVKFFKEAINNLLVGDGLDPRSTTGPVISARARDDIQIAVADSLAAGGKIIVQADIPDSNGYFVAPTVLEGTMSLQTCREEVFGPVTTILNATNLEEAISLANGTEFGLTASIFSTNDADIEYAIENLAAGIIKVNAPNTGSELHVPFGGTKASTVPGPREQNSETARDFFTTTVSVYRRQAPRSNP